MPATSITNRPLLQFANVFWQWKLLWILTTAAFGATAFVYVVVLKKDVWVASQGLIVRDEANGAVTNLGRFESQTAMRAAQETVLEMARSTQVLASAFESVGPETGLFAWTTPTPTATAAQLEELAKNVAVTAPRGAELGTTEVIYLEVRQESRTRALALTDAICNALETRLKEVREAKAKGVISELESAKIAASAELAKSTEHLQRIEAEVGSDISDLRGLTDASSIGISSRQSLDQVTTELRQAELELKQVRADLDIARSSLDNPDQLLQTPTKLNSQPGLRRLREGLAAAAIASSQLASRYTQSHPLVVAAKETQQRIRGELRTELREAVATLSNDFEIANAKVEKLQQQKVSLESRLTKLASVRASYGNVISEVDARNQRLQDAERELASAIAARDAARVSSLLTRIDKPIIGENPIGPGKTTILAGASFAGLFFGCGLVFLLTPIDSSVNYGRRSQDFKTGRRSSDSRENEQTQRRAETPLSFSATESFSAAESSPPVSRRTETVDQTEDIGPNTASEPPSQARMSRSISDQIAAALATHESSTTDCAAHQGCDNACGSCAGSSGNHTADVIDTAEQEGENDAAGNPLIQSEVEIAGTEESDGNSEPTSAAEPELTAALGMSLAASESESPTSGSTTQGDIDEARAVIAAALQCSFPESDNELDTNPGVDPSAPAK